MKKAIKIAAAIVAVLLIVLVLFIYNAFCGNPFSAMYAKHQITQYINRTYPDSGYQISFAEYSFKDGKYSCEIIDPDSPDGNFTATYMGQGAVDDSYDLSVTQKENILYRLETGFRNEIDPMIDKYLITQSNDEETNSEFGFGTVMGLNKELDRSALYRDMTFDVKDMPIPTLIVICLRTDDETSLNRVRQMAQDMQKAGYRIDYYSFTTDQYAYEEVPTDVLFEAQKAEELAGYRLM